MTESKIKRHFASDNNSGICPEVMAALAEANRGHAIGYGDDAWTERARKVVCDLFETDCDVFFVYNGTAANSLALATICDSYHATICFDYSHVETDECNAPGFFAPGSKLIAIGGDNGKLTPAAIEHAAKARRDVHASMVRAISLTQATELGTVYTPDDIRAITGKARDMGLLVHMDGARFANAIVSLDVKPAALTWQAGVDVLCFGGTKNGMAAGEAVVFFKRELAKNFLYRCKQAGQLASKMRFLSAQWLGALESGAWLRNAGQANRIAGLLETKLRAVPGLKIIYPRQANAVFVEMPVKLMEALWARGWHFYTDVGPIGARLMASWDSREEDVDAFVKDVVDLSK